MYPMIHRTPHAITARHLAFVQVSRLQAEYKAFFTALTSALGSEAAFWEWERTTPRNISHWEFISLMQAKLAELNGGAE